MFSRLIVPFETVSADVTFAEEPLESGDDIIMSFLVQQDELFVWVGVSKARDVEGAVGIHQEDLVVIEGRRLAELGQFFITAGTEWDMGIVMEFQGLVFLYLSSISERVPLRVLVYFGFGSDQGAGTA